MKLEYRGNIGAIKLNRENQRNSFTLELMLDLIEAAKWFNARSKVKVVIISGNGPSFCAGFDMNFFSLETSALEVRKNVAWGPKLVEAIANMQAITIASVHGHCIGGGVMLMAACDFRYVSTDASFWLPEVEIGIPLAWGGIPLLVREIGPLLTTEFVLLGESINADAALRMGLIHGVVEREELTGHVSRLAQKLCSLSSFVLQTTKQQITAARESITSGVPSFCDAHLLYAALLDDESRKTRSGYLERFGHR
ncbi:MAG: enoyl-CoA hydratase/isomerase family protein [Deltaproteobacteria bacterium]|nr:enoyl-CoA hydratase/isomerase family protein [Deltaproteobacteria bacterium]